MRKLTANFDHSGNPEGTADAGVGLVLKVGYLNFHIRADMSPNVIKRSLRQQQRKVERANHQIN